MKLDLHLFPYTNSNSEWIKDLNVNIKTTGKEGNTGKKFHDIDFGNDTFDVTAKHRQ